MFHSLSKSNVFVKSKPLFYWAHQLCGRNGLMLSQLHCCISWILRRIRLIDFIDCGTETCTNVVKGLSKVFRTQIFIVQKRNKNSSRCFTSLGWPFLQHLGSRGSPKCNIDKGHRLWLRTCPWGLGFDGNFGWFIEMFKNQQAFWIYLCNQVIW